mmetsp:Transcript_8348/g.22973  ORF Transcript_8348/g.22973 Transcript_8348/m.22973 type:complete len:236 (+) Transcript_8348:513-1220(+)
MYDPSRDGPSSSSTSFFVTSATIAMRSKAHSFLRAATCITAVRKAWGLERPEIHVDLGTARSVIHSFSWRCRSSTLPNHDERRRSDGQESASHVDGTRWSARDTARDSMASVMDTSPLRPASKSTRDRRMPARSVFMRTHSCRNTLVKGDAWASAGRRSSSSPTLNSSGNRSMTSSRRRFAVSCSVMPDPEEAVRGWSSAMASKSSEVRVDMTSISELGWSPNAAGVSDSRCSSM